MRRFRSTSKKSDRHRPGGIARHRRLRLEEDAQQRRRSRPQRSATPGSAQDFTVNVGDRIFFDTDSSSIRADAQATLSKQAQWLSQYGNYAITVEGHADERGTREYNLALGARRAAATRDFLIAQGRRSEAAEAPSPTARNVRSPSATTSPAGRQNRRAVTVLNGAGS